MYYHEKCLIMTGVPKFSRIQTILQRVFYSPEKSITIYTEDKQSDKLFYTIILKRLVIEEVKINNIIPLGPKNIVVEQSILSQSTKYNSLFIVDGDISLMYGDNLETSNLVSLNRYCIENYLCCHLGILDYLQLKLNEDKYKLERNLNYSNYLLKNGKLILRLYHRLAISYKFKCGCTFYNANVFFNNPGPPRRIDRNLINQEIRHVEEIIKKKFKSEGVKSYKQKLNIELLEIQKNNPEDITTILKVLSGKDQLFPLIRLKIDAIDRSSRPLSNDQMKRILAERIDLSSLEFIKRKILVIANN